MISAFVTGADRNIGLAICRALLARGCFVYAGRYNETLALMDALRNECPDSMRIVRADVSSRESLEAAADAIRADGGTLDLIVHNAAHFGVGSLDICGEVDLSRSDRPFDVNALGAIRVTQAMLPLLRPDGLKRLCYISSEAGSVAVQTRDQISDYCMSKASLNMAVRLMFNRLRPLGYTFRLFHPGWVRSPEDGVGFAPGKLDPSVAGEAAVKQFLEERDWEDCLQVIDYAGRLWPF